MSPLVEQIEALLALNAKGAISHRIPGLAVELLTKAAQALSPPLSALPGEAEVVELRSDAEKIRWLSVERERLIKAAVNVATQRNELILSLQAMQARAEAAEKELETQFYQHVDDLAKARGESEADKQSIVDLTDRVKELEEALKPFAAITEIPTLGCVTKDMVITARTALTGASNG